MTAVNNQVRSRLQRAADAHLYEVMKYKKRYIVPHNFSTVQYMNASGLISMAKLKELVIKAMIKEGKGRAFLNMGTAPGILEYMNDVLRRPVHISSVEWDKQIDCCALIRERLNVDIDYVCNDITSDDFEIRDIKTYFDYIILDRFFPIYQGDIDKVEQVLTKVSKYAKRAFIVESDGNWKKGQLDHLLKIAQKRYKISPEWNCFVVDLESRKK